MSEPFTSAARQAIAASHREAHALGDRQIRSGHVLLGLLTSEGTAAELLGSFDIDSERARSAMSPASAPLSGPARPVRFDRHARRILEAAFHESARLNHHSVGTAHMLLALIQEAEARDASYLSDVVVDLADLHAAVTSRMQDGTLDVDGEAPPSLPDLGEPPTLPGPHSAVRALAATVVVFLVLCGCIGWAAGPDVVETEVLASALAVLTLLLLVLSAGSQRHRLRLRAAGTPPTSPIDAGDLPRAVASSGVTELEIYMPFGRARRRNVSYGLGRHGFIRVAPDMMRSPAARFVLAHEVGHIARKESLRLSAVPSLAIFLVCVGLLAGDPVLLVASIVGAVVFAVGHRWVAEFACDKIAARWIGAQDTERALAVLQAGMKLMRKTPKGFVRWSLAWRLHPPLWLRRRVALRHTAPAGDAGQAVG